MPAGSEPGRPLPMTAEQWHPYLIEYSEWYVSGEPREATALSLTDEQHRMPPWLGQDPATEEQLAATEERLGIRLPPSLRGFLLTSNGWGPVSFWTDALCSCEQIDWFRNTNATFIDAAESAEGALEEDSIFLHALSLAKGEDTILLDTRSATADGEYGAYLFAVKYGDPGDRCASFSEAIAMGREEIEQLRDD